MKWFHGPGKMVSWAAFGDLWFRPFITLN